MNFKQLPWILVGADLSRPSPIYRPSLGFRNPDEKVKTHNELEKAVKRIPYVQTSRQCHLHYRILLHVIALILCPVVLASRCCSHRNSHSCSLDKPDSHGHSRSDPCGDGNDCGATALYCSRDPVGRRPPRLPGFCPPPPPLVQRLLHLHRQPA